MKRYIVLTAAAVLALLSGCSRSEMPGKENSVPGATSRLKAQASFAEDTRSHLGNDGYNLVWDATDKIYAYSYCLGTWEGFEEKTAEMYTLAGIDPAEATLKDQEDMSIMAYFRLLEAGRTNGQVRSGVFEIDPIGSGKVNATFTSVAPAESLFGEPENPTNEEIYLFYAFYPAPANIPAPKSYCFSDNILETVRTTPFPYVDVEVPAEQDGVHYQDYQLLMDCSQPAYFKNALRRTDDELFFSEFTPLTSIFEFTLGTTDDIKAKIARLDISVETQEEPGGPYVGGKYMLGGKVPCFFTWDEPNELRIWNRYCAPLLGGFSREYADYTIPNPADYDYAGNKWDGLEDASPVVTIKFDTPVDVSNTQTEQKYYAVVIPSRCTNPVAGMPHIVFDAYNAAGDKILTKTITTSSSEGIGEGKKYSFDLTLDTYYDENVLSGLFSVDEGKQIYIARGNLQAHLSGGTVDQWRIAQHQYDFVGESSVNLSTYTGWFDLFGFSSTANNFGISNSTADADYVGDPLGWTGAYPVARGNGWRTITADEGVYLFTGRNNAMSLFAFATILVGTEETPVKGLVFLPDQWALPAGCSFSSVSLSGYDFTINNFNADGASSAGSGDWEAMEAAGAVFWPMAGRRTGSNVNLDLGAYWSESPDDHRANEACMLEFTDLDGGYFSPAHFPRYYGACVRLIKDLN